MVDGLYKEVEFKDICGEEHIESPYVRSHAVIRQAAPLDSQRFVAYLGPEWMSMVPRSHADDSCYLREAISRLRLRTSGVPAFGKVSGDVGLEQVMKQLWACARTRVPVELTGECVYNQHRAGRIYTADPEFCCLHLYGLQLLPEHCLDRDDDFMKDRNQPLVILRNFGLGTGVRVP